MEGPGFYPHLSGRRNLTLFDAAGKNGDRGHPARRASTRCSSGSVWPTSAAARCGPTPWACASGSAWRPRCCAEPRLLILDEPTNGLDPQGIHELRTLFVDLVQEGTTVFLSSHLLAEVELICTRAAMMANGRLVAQDRVDGPPGPQRA